MRDADPVPPDANATEPAPPDSVEWIGGVPYVPSEEAGSLMDRAAGDWSELMRRLAQ
jgi:hypothetical protein